MKTDKKKLPLKNRMSNEMTSNDSRKYWKYREKNTTNRMCWKENRKREPMKSCDDDIQYLSVENDKFNWHKWWKEIIYQTNRKACWKLYSTQNGSNSKPANRSTNGRKRFESHQIQMIEKSSLKGQESVCLGFFKGSWELLFILNHFMVINNYCGGSIIM